MTHLHNTYNNIAVAAERGLNGCVMLKGYVGNFAGIEKPFGPFDYNLKNKSRPYTENM